ncbi:hypothetical protein Tco_1009454, partial [Tanacetum coccineum]
MKMDNLSEDINVSVLIPDHRCLTGPTLHHGNKVFDCIVRVPNELKFAELYSDDISGYVYADFVQQISYFKGFEKTLYTSSITTLMQKTSWDNGRQNRGQGNNARGTGAAGNGGAQNRVGNANPGQARQIKCYNY